MLRIGEFAAITGISIHMLRNYDKIGLLKPEMVDTESSYRYYSEKQIVIANQIQMLKDLGFGLKEIETIQLTWNSSQKMKEFLRAKIEEKEQMKHQITQQIKQMEQAIDELEKKEQYAMTVTVKHIPKRKVAFVRSILHEFSQEGELWQQLTMECQRLKVKFADVDYSYEITHHIDWKGMELDVEVQRIVEELHEDTDLVQFKEVAECEAATVAFCGRYEQIGAIHQYVMGWICKNGYQMDGLSFSTYYLSPGNEKNPENYITELCFPIRKK